MTAAPPSNTSTTNTQENEELLSNEDDRATIVPDVAGDAVGMVDDRDNCPARSDGSFGCRGATRPSDQRDAAVEALPPHPVGWTGARPPPQYPYGMSLIGLLARGVQPLVPPTLVPGSFATTTETTLMTTRRLHATCGSHHDARRGGRDDEWILQAGTGSRPAALHVRVFRPRPAALRRSRDRAGIEWGRQQALRSVRQRAALIALIEAALSGDGGDWDDAVYDEGGPT